MSPISFFLSPKRSLLINILIPNYFTPHKEYFFSPLPQTSFLSLSSHIFSFGFLLLQVTFLLQQEMSQSLQILTSGVIAATVWPVVAHLLSYLSKLCFDHLVVSIHLLEGSVYLSKLPIIIGIGFRLLS